MAKDFSRTHWHGVPRQDIPWFPTVDLEICIGCELCFVTCGRDVYEIKTVDSGRLKSSVERPFNCMVGCSTCSAVCPSQAIKFPPQEIVRDLEKKHKIFKTVREEARQKRENMAASSPSSKAEEKPKG